MIAAEELAVAPVLASVPHDDLARVLDGIEVLVRAR